MTSVKETEHTSTYYSLTENQRKMAVKQSLGLQFPDEYIVTVPDFNASIRCSIDHLSAKIIPDKTNSISNELIMEAEGCNVSRSSEYFWACAFSQTHN